MESGDCTFNSPLPRCLALQFEIIILVVCISAGQPRCLRFVVVLLAILLVNLRFWSVSAGYDSPRREIYFQMKELQEGCVDVDKSNSMKVTTWKKAASLLRILVSTCYLTRPSQCLLLSLGESANRIQLGTDSHTPPPRLA